VVVVVGDVINVIAWMAPVPPFRLAGRASFLYETNLELGSEQAWFYQLKLNAQGLVQLIARRSWQVGSGHGRRLHAGRQRGRQWHTGALQASSHGTSCPALPCWLRFFMSAATCAVAAEQGLPPLPLPAQLEPS